MTCFVEVYVHVASNTQVSMLHTHTPFLILTSVLSKKRYTRMYVTEL